jgi:hypothetical protein
VHADPADVRLADNYFNLRMRLVQERSRFQSALTRADHCYPFPRKPADIPSLIAMHHLLEREALENGGLPLERTDPCGNHHRLRANLLTVLKGKSEAWLVPVNTQNSSWVKV